MTRAHPALMVHTVRALPTLLFAAAVVVAACDDPAPPPEASEPPPLQAPRGQPELDSPPPSMPEPPEPPAPSDLDDMAEGELQAACFAGDRRACDRLGH
jgi:hypothetical protein